MPDLPLSLQITKEAYLEQYRNDILASSQGRLFDFSTSSVLSIIGEAQSLSIERLIETQKEIIPYISANLLEMMGFRRSQGTYALATARFQLSNIFDRDYVILRSTRFGLGNGVVFSTLSDLIIPANLDTTNPDNYQYCRVDAIALTVGSSGNQPTQEAQILQVYPELEGIWIDEPSAGGNDEETPEEFFSRVSLILGKFLENQFSLIQSSEFELAVEGLLGNGSVAVAVPDISDDGSRVEIASMNIYATNPDGTTINSAQIRNLSVAIASRAPLVGGRLYFSNLVLPLVNIDVTIKISQSTDSNTISDAINSKLREVFSIKNTADLASLELYEAVYQVKLLGALTPVVKWGYAGDILQARDLPLPKIAAATDETKPAKIDTIKIIIEPSGSTKTYTK